MKELVQRSYPEKKENTRSIWTGEFCYVAHEMKEGDWIVLPSKLKRATIHFGEIIGPYMFEKNAENLFQHFRKVKWFRKDVPRSTFDQDILYSFGALLTVCKIEKNDAEKRTRAVISGEKPQSEPSIIGTIDLELLARDQIAKYLIEKYKGHGLARLVDAILRTQGYTTYLSPEGPDKGVDILAAPGPLGFGNPRICVQVKSGDNPVDTPMLNQLIGTMQNVQADQGLLVSWGGFKGTIDKEIPIQFFRVRLWDQDDLVSELLDHYEQIDEDIRAEIPLKRIWTITPIEEV
jgi:restriction system protein